VRKPNERIDVRETVLILFWMWGRVAAGIECMLYCAVCGEEAG
jgi:hypothetical protein